MKTNINTELFKKYAPKKKLEIIESLTQEELLAITPKTVTRMVKEAGEGKKGSPNTEFKVLPPLYMDSERINKIYTEEHTDCFI